MVFNIRLQYKGAPKYLGESVTGTEKGLEKEMMRFGASVIFGTFGVGASRCTDEPWRFHCTCAVVFLP